MLKRLTCSDPRFTSIDFRPGINLILADKTATSTTKDTRNGLGKSTLIEIIHFCLGASFSRCKTLVAPELVGWGFDLELSIGTRLLTVRRNTASAQKILLSGNCDGLRVGTPSTDKDAEGWLSMTVGGWTSLLGNMVFDLPLEAESGAKYKPSYRGLLSYYIRRGPGSYLDPFMHFAKQSECDKQICNAFHLNLNWQHAADYQHLKDKEKVLVQWKQQAANGTLPGISGTSGELEATKVNLQQQVRAKQQRIDSFQVHPEYRQIERSAAELTQTMHSMSEQNIQDERLIAFYCKSIDEEQEPSTGQLLAMYDELNLQLPTLVKKRFQDVEDFHHKLISNRRTFLTTEIERLRALISARTHGIDKLSTERTECLKILRTQGALEEYSQLVSTTQEKVGQLKAVEKQIQLINGIAKGKSTLRVEQEILFQKAQADFNERIGQRDRAIELFNNNSHALYNLPGKLLMELTNVGFKFGVDIERSPSEGVGHMKVFCYDFTILQLARERRLGIDFLVHDSTIFDGVDERQIASALIQADRVCNEQSLQYICTFNTDSIPTAELAGLLDLTPLVRRTLTDVGESGGLLGFRLGSTESQDTSASPEINDEQELSLMALI